ncbi:hypothetical protein NQZ68_006059 [Dissostichus eleginoides]|nr:hypothetical protein NQZ68_006059 [Dissostichus eleginoides]
MVQEAVFHKRLWKVSHAFNFLIKTLQRSKLKTIVKRTMLGNIAALEGKQTEMELIEWQQQGLLGTLIQSTKFSQNLAQCELYDTHTALHSVRETQQLLLYSI